MFINNIDPVLLSIGPFEIRYYGLAYLVGFIIAYFMICFLAKERKLKLTKDNITDLLVYVAVGGIAGARILHILENFNYYISNPFEIPALWHGGLSFYGGFIGAAIAGLIFCKKHKIDFYKLADIAVIPLALGLAFGRLANFTNSELYGKITDLPWCVQFRNADGCRHPSQIYESIKNIFIFSVLFFARNLKMPKGLLFWLFVSLYSFLRFFMEFFREQTYLLFNLSIAQLLAAAAFLTSTTMLFKLKG